MNATALVVVPTNINGDGNHAMASSVQEEDHTATLSAGATTFLPYTSKPVKTTPAPISYLNHDSTADEAGIGGPVIVSSQIVAPTAVMQDKAKGKASQEPIGTRGANFSPSRPRTFFTTDVGPHVVMPGSHYVKITNIPQEELSKVLLHMHVNVSCSKHFISRYQLTDSTSSAGLRRFVESTAHRRRRDLVSEPCGSALMIFAMLTTHSKKSSK